MLLRFGNSIQALHIVVVDSDPTAALVTQFGLQRVLGTAADVQVAASPDMAWVDCQQKQIDLIVVDPSPASRAASAFLRTLRNECPQVIVVVLTAYDTPRLRAEMRALGIRHYLAKPVDLECLTNTVQLALKQLPAVEEDRFITVS